jgi:uncharacterized protein involved in copper resistance
MSPRRALIVIAAVTLGIIGGLLLALSAPQAAQPVEFDRITLDAPATPAPAVDPVIEQLMPGTEVTPERAQQLAEAADRVCEGVAAQVPVVDMAATLSADLGLDDTEARTFVAVAADTRGC